MPDNFEGDQQIAQRGMQRGFPGGMQRGFPGGMQRFPGGFPRFPRGGFPRRFPMRRIFPRPIIFPFFFGFPTERCFFVDQFGRCCDRFGNCCDRFGGCGFGGFDGFPLASTTSTAGNWYGMPGGWDMMPDMDDAEDVMDYDRD